MWFSPKVFYKNSKSKKNHTVFFAPEVVFVFHTASRVTDSTSTTIQCSIVLNHLSFCYSCAPCDQNTRHLQLSNPAFGAIDVHETRWCAQAHAQTRSRLRAHAHAHASSSRRWRAFLLHATGAAGGWSPRHRDSSRSAFLWMKSKRHDVMNYWYNFTTQPGCSMYVMIACFNFTTQQGCSMYVIIVCFNFTTQPVRSISQHKQFVPCMS